MSLLRKITSILLVIGLILQPIGVSADSGTQEETGVDDIYFEGTDTTRSEKEEIRTYPSRETCLYGWYFMQDYTEYEHKYISDWIEYDGAPPIIEEYDTLSYETRNAFREKIATDVHTDSGWLIYDSSGLQDLQINYQTTEQATFYRYYKENVYMQPVQVFDGYVYTGWVSYSSKSGYTLYDTRSVYDYTSTCTADSCPSGWSKTGTDYTARYLGTTEAYSSTKRYDFTSGDYYYEFYDIGFSELGDAAGYHKKYEMYDECEKDYYKTQYKFRKRTYRTEYEPVIEKEYIEGYYQSAPAGYDYRDSSQSQEYMIGRSTNKLWSSWSDWTENTSSEVELNESYRIVEVENQIQTTETVWRRTQESEATGITRTSQERVYSVSLSATQPAQGLIKDEHMVICSMEFNIGSSVNPNWVSQEYLINLIRESTYVDTKYDSSSVVVNYPSKTVEGITIYRIVDELGTVKWVSIDELPVNLSQYDDTGVHSDYNVTTSSGLTNYIYNGVVITDDEIVEASFNLSVNQYAFIHASGQLDNDYNEADRVCVSEEQFCAEIEGYTEDESFVEKVYFRFIEEGQEIYNNAVSEANLQKQLITNEADLEYSNEYSKNGGINDKQATIDARINPYNTPEEKRDAGYSDIDALTGFTDAEKLLMKSGITDAYNGTISLMVELEVLKQNVEDDRASEYAWAESVYAQYVSFASNQLTTWGERANDVLHSNLSNRCDLIYNYGIELGKPLPEYNTWFAQNAEEIGRVADIMQTAIDFVAMIPGLDVLDAVNGMGYLSRGKIFDAAFSFLGVALPALVEPVIQGVKVASQSIETLIDLLPSSMVDLAFSYIDEFITFAKNAVDSTLLPAVVDFMRESAEALARHIDGVNVNSLDNFMYDEATGFFYKQSDGVLKEVDLVFRVDLEKALLDLVDEAGNVIPEQFSKLLDDIKLGNLSENQMKELVTNTKDLLSNTQKGYLGEAISDITYRSNPAKEGFEMIPSKISGNQGIDGLYFKYELNADGSYVLDEFGDKVILQIDIVEAKYGTSTLNKFQYGDGTIKQMDDNWIRYSAERMLESTDPEVIQAGEALLDALDSNPEIITKYLDRISKETGEVMTNVLDIAGDIVS